MKSTVLNKMNFTIKKYSPEILMGAGIIGVVTSTVMACKATTKAAEIMEEMKKNIDTIHECRETCDEEKYSDNNYKKDLTLTYIQTGIKFVKLYGPAVSIGLASLTSILASNNILKKRNAAMTAAYATVSKTLMDYRERVVDKYGSQIDRELRYGIKAQEIEETVTDEKGKEKSIKKTVEVVNIDECSEFAKFFDASSRCWDKDPETNLTFLRAQERYANDLLKAKGRLFLNEVYDMLDIPPTKAGQIMGWVYDPEGIASDNYVDFGIYDTYRNSRFVNGYEPVILLDFNIHGNVWETM